MKDEYDQQFTISGDKLDCMACPKNCHNCYDRDEEERLIINPFFEIDTIYSTNSKTCSLCSNVAGILTWNSHYSRCVDCSTFNCKKRI